MRRRGARVAFERGEWGRGVSGLDITNKAGKSNKKLSDIYEYVNVILNWF